MLDIKNKIVTIDAMGCQKKIAQQIIEQEGDYVFNLKGNQSSLHEDVKLFIESYIDKKTSQSTVFDMTEIVGADHGRVETRRYWVTDNIAWLEQSKDWQGLKSIGMVEYEQITKSTGEIQIGRRCFITSLAAKAKPFAHAVRQHWGIESAPQAHKKEVYYEDRLKACA